MIRVLHLMGPSADFQARSGSTALRAGAGEGFAISTRSIGPRRTYRDSLSAVRALHRRVRREFELVHAWDFTSLMVAALSGADRVLFSPSTLPGRRGFRWMRGAMLFRHLGVVCPVAGWRDAFLAGGVSHNYLRVIPPDFRGYGDSSPNKALRAELGFDDGDHVVLAPGESTRAAGHRAALWAVSILHVFNPRVKLLTWGHGNETEALLRLSDKLGQPTVITVAERKLKRCIEFAELPAACDAVIFAPRCPTATLPLQICKAAGLPIIATPTIEAREVLGESAFYTARDTPRLIAQELLRVIEDHSWTPPLNLFGGENAFLEDYRAAYRFFSGKE